MGLLVDGCLGVEVGGITCLGVVGTRLAAVGGTRCLWVDLVGEFFGAFEIEVVAETGDEDEEEDGVVESILPASDLRLEDRGSRDFFLELNGITMMYC